MNLSESQYFTMCRSQFDWIKVKLPQVIDEMFQDITDVKIQCMKGLGGFTVAKEPNQATKVSSIRRRFD